SEFAANSAYYFSISFAAPEKQRVELSTRSNPIDTSKLEPQSAEQPITIDGVYKLNLTTKTKKAGKGDKKSVKATVPVKSATIKTETSSQPVKTENAAKDMLKYFEPSSSNGKDVLSFYE
ncbi:MAG: hypothetical protein ABIE84_05055, partial [bacterium]